MSKKIHHIIRKQKKYKLFFCLLPIVLFMGCKKDIHTKLDVEFQTQELIYFPYKHVSITFDIVAKEDIGNYQFKWLSPDSLKGKGPYTLILSNNLLLDLEITDNENMVQRFQHEIKIDTIDSLKYDYRNRYVGKYSCHVTYAYRDYFKAYIDTLIIEKYESFNKFIIFTINEHKNQQHGLAMTYLDPDIYTNYPFESFYGYHAIGSFSNDSIHYEQNGPLGAYYNMKYEGKKIVE